MIEHPPAGSPPLSFYFLGWVPILLHLAWLFLGLAVGFHRPWVRGVVLIILAAEIASIAVWSYLYARYKVPA